ncbi:MAG: class I SAM-dependent methyltransferase [Clostridiales bacterium]|nr:class I SAM-dependent methyltransferase [Clostridiales bacterium]
MTFWDFCAPFYDFAEKSNGKTYAQMLETVREIVPTNTSVLEMAAGTAAIGLAIAGKVESVLCTDVSERMLSVARKKAKKRGVANIHFANLNILDIDKQDHSFDVAIAGQVLHLLDEPEKAAAELRRVAKDMVILPMCFTKDLRGKAKLDVRFYKLFGFAPKLEFDADSYADFLPKIGFENCEMIQIPGNFPMAVAVWKGGGEK